MYKVEINIADWDFVEDEKLVIQTTDFEKVQIIQEFIEMQKEYGWAADYVAVQEFEEDEDEEFGDEYYYDEEADEWIEVDAELYEEDEDEDEDEDEGVEFGEDEDEASTVTTYMITKIED